ncbi:hypothetical protein CYMTET_53414 [Cymbomonas tetramitiformis]|uniref:Uncharacterized protein n=1 Tax=Cymbomonas tetramitiformis TaxID=36881 RepID=A0AAE0BH28_9CHLO|nr:hypothetical protein CYMTET_53414 [Cymbomonas tetramitiformis]
MGAPRGFSVGDVAGGLHNLADSQSRWDEGRKFALNHIHVETDDVRDGKDGDDGADYSTDEDAFLDDEDSLAMSPCVPAQGCYTTTTSTDASGTAGIPALAGGAGADRG